LRGELIALVNAGRAEALAKAGSGRGDRILPSKMPLEIAMVQRNAGSFQNVRYFPAE
jgi:hypothetical protein